MIREFIREPSTGGRWQPVSETPWPYDFPPMIHWQNLPSLDGPTGLTDIPADVLALQDRINFSSSNLSKIVRLFAHPQRFGRNLGNTTTMQMGPDDMPVFSGEGAEVVQLPPVGDLTAALEVFRSLRQALFDITRSVDIDSMQDKLGGLTNFALRVLYQDNLAKIATKRELMGDALEEINRRVQILSGMQPIPSTVVWPDFLPASATEATAAAQADLNMGIVSRQTVSTQRGYDWEQEQGRIGEEKQGETNLGAEILRAFEQGSAEGGSNGLA